MFFSKTVAALATTALLAAQSASGLGINCRGSGLCPLASFENQGNVNILQGLRDAVYSSKAPDSTRYDDGQHVICVSSTMKINIDAGVSAGAKGASASVSVGLSGKIGSGGVCVFPQNTGARGTTLGQVKTMLDGLLDHGCTACGSNPTQPGNDVKKGQITVNYVKAPGCTKNCLSVGSNANPTAPHKLRGVSFAA